MGSAIVLARVAGSMLCTWPASRRRSVLLLCRGNGSVRLDLRRVSLDAGIRPPNLMGCFTRLLVFLRTEDSVADFARRSPQVGANWSQSFAARDRRFFRAP